MYVWALYILLFVGAKEQNRDVTKRKSEAQAIQVMRDGGLEPQVPYISNSVPWLSKCLLCGSDASPSLKSVQNRSVSRKGCRFCAPNAPIAAEKAVEVMMRASLEPLEPFSGSVSKWKCRCLKCESIVYPTYGSIKSGQIVVADPTF